MSIVQPNIQLTATDLSKIIFVETQQRLAKERDVYKEQAYAIFEQAKQLAEKFLDEEKKFFLAENEKKINTILSLIQKEYPKQVIALEVESPDATRLLAGMSFGNAYFHCTKPRIAFSVNFVQEDFDEGQQGEMFNIAGIDIPAFNSYEVNPDKKAIKLFIESIKALHDEYMVFARKRDNIDLVLQGKPDANTGVTLEDHITASIATQAVKQIPALSEAFDTSFIMNNIYQKLIPNELSS